MYIAILGRQPALGITELECLYGADSVRWFSDTSATIDSSDFNFERLGGAQKAGRVVASLHGDWRQIGTQLISTYAESWKGRNGKITLGISAYGFTASARDVQKVGIILKGKLKNSGVSLRLIPNLEPALNTATSHHNKLGLSENKVELLIIRSSNGRVIIAESVGAQNITALAARDQARPKTDAFVGMLPPKLARMMINFASPLANENIRILDPFCGTGVVLQEAALLGYNSYGTDLSEKMVDYSRQNLAWIVGKRHLHTTQTIEQGDAMAYRWTPPVDAVVCETYLGQPFSAPPSPTKLEEVRGNCNHIVSTFLRNIAPQIAPNTPLILAIPAWRAQDGHFAHLPLINELAALGYTRAHLDHVRDEQLLYYRENQVVARELLILRKS